MKLLLCWLIAFIYQSNVQAQTESVNHSIIQVNKACLRSAVECLELVETELKTTAPNTYIWFDLLQHKFDALFDLQKFEELNQAIMPWIEQQKLPNSFQITLFIYYAKTSFLQENNDDAHKYSQKAKEKLVEMNQVFPSPMRIIKLANLQMSLEEDDIAYETLQTLEQKYQKSRNAHLMMELYGNLGHVTRRLSLDELSLAYWLKALPWSIKYNNQQQIGTVLLNLAKAYFVLAQYAEAEHYFIETQKVSKEAGDQAKVNQAQLHLVEVKLKQLQPKQAKALFEQINVEPLSKNYLLRMEKLREMLNIDE